MKANSQSPITRRQFLKVAGGVGIAASLAACTAPPPAQAPAQPAPTAVPPPVGGKTLVL
ncbi:MAG: twin-arginine translocation signal domain-containing protein, partial [Candidatus Roseilinea sp.]|uniref:twin-arginine translocation signal domain-containing protein n=1 Tax=Candidatus Roseilinea sp. TaxID=2838777 RepID=UPI00404907CD